MPRCHETQRPNKLPGKNYWFMSWILQLVDLVNNLEKTVNRIHEIDRSIKGI